MSAWLYTSRLCKEPIQVPSHELRGDWLLLIELGGRVVRQYKGKVRV
jgi:hypothetical protein